jgi:hypothetical protein
MTSQNFSIIYRRETEERWLSITHSRAGNTAEQRCRSILRIAEYRKQLRTRTARFGSQQGQKLSFLPSDPDQHRTPIHPMDTAGTPIECKAVGA